MPGQAQYNFGRKIIMRGADGLVFVADSQTERMRDNLDSLLDLEIKLASNSTSLSHVPWVIQYNKRDLLNINPMTRLEAKLNFLKVPAFEAVAIKGTGVFETLKAVIQLVVSSATLQKQKKIKEYSY